jgi:hypothetical protein
MDLDDVETIHFNALVGTDNINVGDLSGTDAKRVAIDLAGTIGGATGDGQIDSVTVNGTNGDDVVSVSLVGGKVAVDGLPAQVTADHAAADDKLIVNGLVRRRRHRRQQPSQQARHAAAARRRRRSTSSWAAPATIRSTAAPAMMWPSAMPATIRSAIPARWTATISSPISTAMRPADRMC